MEADKFVAAVEAIYRSAAVPSNWPDALQAVADVFGDVGANLIWVRDNGSYGTILSPGLAPLGEDYEKWQHADIRAQHAAEKSMASRLDVVTDRHLVTDREIEEHPFYTQFLVPAGLGWLAAARLSPDPLIEVWISVQRAKAKEPFSDQELETLGRLGRHAEQSLRLSSGCSTPNCPGLVCRKPWRASASGCSRSIRCSGSSLATRPRPAFLAMVSRS